MDPRRTIAIILSAVLVLAAVAWAYWSTLTDIGERWATDPQYSHGFLVPVFSLYLLWRGRKSLHGAEIRARWWGVGVVLAGAALRLAGHVFYQPWLDAGSLLVVLAGLAAAAGGWRVLKWAAPAVLFLGFMIPLPHRAQTLLGGNLQSVATYASTYLLQTLGVPAVSEGNIILLTDTRLGVVEACSGLTMLYTFFALATGVAILAPRHWVEKGLLVLSAAPIAVVSNIARITVTGLLYEANQGDLARAVFHDLAGWLMMPFGLTLLLAELFVMARSVRRVGPRNAGQTSGPTGTAAPSPAARPTSAVVG